MHINKRIAFKVIDRYPAEVTAATLEAGFGH